MPTSRGPTSRRPTYREPTSGELISGELDYTFEKELEFGVLRGVFETKLDRALGMKANNVKNERVMLQSQFSENRQINEDGNNHMIKEGFFKRLLGRRG